MGLENIHCRREKVINQMLYVTTHCLLSSFIETVASYRFANLWLLLGHNDCGNKFPSGCKANCETHSIVDNSRLLRNEGERAAFDWSMIQTRARRGFHNYIPISDTSVARLEWSIKRLTRVIKISNCDWQIDKSRLHLRNQQVDLTLRNRVI